MVSKVLVFLVLLGVSTGIATLFWRQEARYVLPTPVPANYRPVGVNQLISLPAALSPLDKPVFLHFFNPDCPCSRFNLRQFKELVGQYGSRVHFVAVMPVNEADLEAARQKYGLAIPAVADPDWKLAEACGVYSTPQAVIVDRAGRLYYRGNYNQSRYCTRKNTAFAKMALDSILSRAPSPSFSLFATRAYGCGLPDNAADRSPFYDFLP